MTSPFLSLPLALCLVVASCSRSEDTEASLDQAVRDSVPAGASTTVPSTTTEVINRPQVFTPDVDELAFSIVGPDALDPVDGAGGGATATTSGGNGKPVTTIAGGGGGDVGSIYRGVLGWLEPDEVVAAAVVDPPSVPAGVMPLTGVFGVVPDRPAAVVKIDNGPAARPQTGLNAADIVVEEEVEGGITRFAAIFHSRTSTVGPVRSGRTTDIGVLVGLGSPLLMYSGANRVTDTLLRRQDQVQNRSFETSSGYWRSSGRRAPSNLYTDTEPHWASAHGGPPPAQFAFRTPSAAIPGDAVSAFTVAFRSNRVSWQWDGAAWLRSQGSSAHLVASGDQVAAANVVVIEAEEVATGMVDGSGSNVPEFVFVGTGPATVFTGGHRVSGIWTKPTLASVATLTTASGEVIELTPGRTWIEIVETGAGMLSVNP